ncbi:MAG: bifunctional fucokinase/L-fucose-1-P-guanylyltransferase, partial [Lachnospiraceae bacterium]|nr:bifunctional fucokinase/L-fucose-1-P-guanylyltransferase [Lachnospiraceae bacterium]
MNTSLYLSQSYQDAWSDYQRSLKAPSFPVWDYIILTASNEHQATGFLAQIESRRSYLPEKTKLAVISDEGGVRVGSGGATLSVLKYLREQEESFANLRVLVIHSGGDSKRVPQYSALGKLFSPVPHALPDGRSSTLFDEFLIAMSAIPGRIREGMLLLSGDVLLLFNPLLVDWSGSGAAVISFKEDAETGKDHGVFLRGEDGMVRAFLHKQSVERLRSVGAVNEAGAVDIDTGALFFGVDILNALYSLISTEGTFDEEKYRAFVNSTVRLSLYGDFQYPLAADSTLENFYLEKPEGEYSEELKECRKQLWSALRGFGMKLLRLAPAKFIHFGTTGEILALMNEGVEEYKDLGWSRQVNSSMTALSGYNSVLDPRAQTGEGTYLEVAYVHGEARIGKNCVLSHIDIQDETVPDGVVLHALKQMDGNFVCRIYGIDDNPKDNKLFGRELIGQLWGEREEHTLWNAKIYPEKGSLREAVRAALELYENVRDGKELTAGKSMAAGFLDADPEAILAWNRHMAELVAMDKIASLINDMVPAAQIDRMAPLSGVPEEWLGRRLERAGYSEAMRLHYYIGTALNDEAEVSKAFSVLSSAILASTLKELKENKAARIQLEEYEVRLPLRVNFGGGWSDTPPYCND